MIEVNVLDSAPSEGELLRNAALYFADRLFTKAQRKKLTVIIDVTAQPIRVPITRDMLMAKKGLVGTSPPKTFELTVSTAAGLRDAMEVVAHELIHVSQAHNQRLTITKKKRKYGGEKRLVHLAKWVSGKSTPIEELEWHNRPWEIEACQWQPQLVNEFVERSIGTAAAPPTQKAKKKQLALYKVAPALMTPAAMQPTPSPGPMVTPVAMTMAPEPVMQQPVPQQPVPQQTVPQQPVVQPPVAPQPIPQAMQQPVQQEPHQPAPIQQAPTAQQLVGEPPIVPGVPQEFMPTPAAAPDMTMPIATPAIAEPAAQSEMPADTAAGPATDFAAVMDDEALIAALGGDEDLVPPVDISQFDAPPADAMAETALPDDLSAALLMEQNAAPAVPQAEPAAPETTPLPAIDADPAAEPTPATTPAPAFDPVPAFDPAASAAPMTPSVAEAPVVSSNMADGSAPDTVAAPSKEMSVPSDFGAAPDLSALAPPVVMPPPVTPDQTTASMASPVGAEVTPPVVADEMVAMDEEALSAMMATDAREETSELPSIMVDVPGLNAPRALSRDAVAGKVDELLERGLITAEEAAVARQGASSTIT